MPSWKDAIKIEYPEPDEDDVLETSESNYGLYKCAVCGSMVMGFGKEEHVRESHVGKDVVWKRLSCKKNIKPYSQKKKSPRHIVD